MKTTTFVFLAAIGHAFAAVVPQPELPTEINDINILSQDAAQPVDVPVVLRPKGGLPPSSGPSRPRRKDILLEDGVADTTTEVMVETTTESPESAIDPDFVVRPKGDGLSKGKVVPGAPGSGPSHGGNKEVAKQESKPKKKDRRD